MAPRSKSQQQASAPESTTSRRSARIAGSAAPASDVDGKKRSASAPKSGPASKKQKTTSATKPARSIKSKPAEEKIDEAEEPEAANGADASNDKGDAKANGEEDAPANSKANGNASDAAANTSAEEKKEEAPPSASPEAPSSGILKEGDILPDLTLQNEKGEEVELNNLAGEKGVVLFLYPKADTPGCTNQACGYRDAYDEIRKLGYEVYGLSKDKPAAQQKWKTKKELTYSLLSDPDSKFIKRLGAFVQPNNTKRSHFIFEKGTGKLIDIALGVKPANDPGNCVAFLQKHHK